MSMHCLDLEVPPPQAASSGNSSFTRVALAYRVRLCYQAQYILPDDCSLN